MIFLKEFPNISFETREKAFEYLKSNEKRIINIKCSNVMKSIEKGQFVVENFRTGIVKNIDFVKDDNFYPIINTTKWLDHHLDVHLDKLWDRSLDQQKGKVHYLDSHSLKWSDVIAWPESVTPMTKMIDWRDLGYDVEGKTNALIFEIPKSEIVHELAAKIIKEKRSLPNSVRMQYVKVDLAINSDARELVKNREIYEQLLPEIANKEVAEEYGYFWAVSEAKLFKEGSMVLSPSNEATSIIYENTTEPAKGTSEKGAATGTSDKVASFYKNLY